MEFMPSFVRNLFTLRFSLRAMLVVVTLGCLGLGWRANRLYENQRALQALESYGFSTYTQTPDFNREFRLSFFGNVNLANSRLEPEDGGEGKSVVAPKLWWEVGRLFPLRSLDFQSVELPTREESGAWRRRSNSVKELFLVDCKLRDNAFESAVEQMPELEFLWLHTCQLESHDLSCLSSLRHLKVLRIDEIPLREGDIASIHCPQLEFIKLGEDFEALPVVLSNADVRSLTELRHLREIVIHAEPGLPISQIRELAKCRNLEVFVISVNDEALENVVALEDEMAKALPKCDVQIYVRKSK